MKSIFANLELDTIRYSLVWEDWQTFYNNLDIQPEDDIAVITSAGCNVLNALLKSPASITAIDLNPVQNNLLHLKLQVIEYHDYDTWRGIMGFAGKEAVAEAWNRINETLPKHDAHYWQDMTAESSGLITLGKLEKYITGYFNTLPKTAQEKIEMLFDFDDVASQEAYYSAYLSHDNTFVDSFTTYFADENLGKGRDPRLFTYAEQKGGTAFLGRLNDFVSTHPAKNNFYLWFFFFGPENIPAHILPPCYQPEHFTMLKQQVHKVKCVTGEAVEYLGFNGEHISKASLSNIFEYISHADFKEALSSLYTDKRKLKLLYWNLLQNQEPCAQQKNISFYNVLNEPTRCFYFNNTVVVQNHSSD